MCSLCCTDFAAILFNFFFERRSREINGGEANDDAAANDQTARGASSTHTSTEGQGMATSSGYDYEVFLNFKGPDTRTGFTDFLYTSLIAAGIRAFKDDEDLRVGEEFAPELLQAINQSKISIPIFSRDYASSVWCLKELVQMVECQKTGRQNIIPIFYDVAPTEVRYQTGDYKNAFLLHESKKRCDQKTIGEWKAALRATGEINGHDLQSMPNRREGEFVKTFTQKVFNELKKASLAVSDYLVSVDNQVDAIMKMIGAGTSETRIIGIHGMGGIGKTTIAKIIFNKFLHDFENCCFLSDIRETLKKNGIQHLQNQLISKILKTECMDIKDIDEGTHTIKDRLFNKKVLLLLDDVEERNHIKAFVGKRDWLGRGSKVIIATRNKDILEIPEVNCKYELSCMDDDQSLELFSKHAFRKDYPLDEDIDQSMRAIHIARGLPLTLEVIGSLLCGTKKKKWNLILKKLENVPHATVQSKLKISYDALDVRQQHIFLDIACFFTGYDKDILIHFWDESKYPEETMEVLQNKSLIKIIKDNEVWMHDQLRDLGRDIVHQKSEMKIEKQSRVWDPKEGLDLLRIRKGKTEVEALCLKLDNQWQYRFTYEGFESLSYLRFLEVGGSMKNFCAEERLLWHESPSNVPPANENSYLLPLLRWLSWHRIPPTFNITNFSMEGVVFLDLSMSEITHDWKGWSHMKVMTNLKVMNLFFCQHLERNPNFSCTNSSLERLILSWCDSLIEIDRSICQLKCLVSLDLSYCFNLRRLPDELGRDLASLKYLSLRGCISLERLPDTIGNLKSLIELDIQGSGIKELPDSIGNLESLVKLHIICMKITKLPDSIGNLKSLVELRISLTKIQELPDFFGKLKNLKVVRINGSEIRKIPNTLWTIEKLKEIRANMMYDFDVEIGNCIYRNRSLRILRLGNARIYVVPKLPESLINLDLKRLCMDTIPDLSNLTNLKELVLIFGPRDDAGESNWPIKEYPMPRWIGNLGKLELLALFSPYVTTLPMDISSLLPRLRGLHIRCPNLRCLPSLPSGLSSLFLLSDYVTTLPTDISLLPRLQRLTLVCRNLRCIPSLPSSLLSLRLYYGKSICSLENLSNLKELSEVWISNCAISEIRGLDGLESLRDLQLFKLQQVEIVSDLSNLSKLSNLEVSNCRNLVEIQDKPPPSLETLWILKCGSLKKLPDLSSLKELRHVIIEGCRKLNVDAISSLCSEKSIRFSRDKTNQREKTDEYEYGLEGEDAESEYQFDDDYHEFESEFEVEGEDED